MIAEFLNSKYGIYFLTALIFFVLGYFLRFLFGPKGLFKDPNVKYDDHTQEKSVKHKQEVER